jgi:hypothetical protein
MQKSVAQELPPNNHHASAPRPETGLRGRRFDMRPWREQDAHQFSAAGLAAGSTEVQQKKNRS